MRLIDADALEQDLDHQYKYLCKKYTGYDSYTMGYGDALYTVEDAQAVEDAVLVVRCKDCKYMHIITEQSGKQHFHCQISYGLPEVRETDFCNYGERKTSDEERKSDNE